MSSPGAAVKSLVSDDKGLNGGALLSMLKANAPKIVRYTKEELLSIGQLPASRSRPQELCPLIDKSNLQSPLLIRAKAEKAKDDDARRLSPPGAEGKRDLWDTPNPGSPTIGNDLSSITLGDIRKVEREMAMQGGLGMHEMREGNDHTMMQSGTRSEVDILGHPHTGDKLLGDAGMGNVFCDEAGVEESRGFGKWFNHSNNAARAAMNEEGGTDGTKVNVAELFYSASGRTDLPSVPSKGDDAALHYAAMKGGKAPRPYLGMKSDHAGIHKGAYPSRGPPAAFRPPLRPPETYPQMVDRHRMAMLPMKGYPPNVVRAPLRPNYYDMKGYYMKGPSASVKGKGAMWQAQYYAAKGAPPPHPIAQYPQAPMHPWEGEYPPQGPMHPGHFPSGTWPAGDYLNVAPHPSGHISPSGPYSPFPESEAMEEPSSCSQS